MSTNDLTEIFSNAIRQWRAADSQRMIFGSNMPQTQMAIDLLAEILQKVFEAVPSFSLVKKEQNMEIVVKTENSDGNDSDLTHIPAHLPSMPKVFNQLKIESISLSKGMTGAELKEFFSGMSMKPGEIEGLGGLSAFLQKQGVVHISVDQMRFKLLKDSDKVGSGEGEGAGDAAKTKRKKLSEFAKLRDSVWKKYIDEKLDVKDLKDRHEDILHAAHEDPAQIEKVLKRVLSKQKDMEKFLAHLEQKLFEAGFSDEDVQTLKKKLLKPKKVLIDEDELARLRKIEKEFFKDSDAKIDERLKHAFETIKVIKNKLADETARSEAIIHQIGQGGMILDSKGKVLSVNETAKNILGLSEEDIHGKNITNILKPHHILTTVSDWQSETETNTPKEVKVQALSDETLAIIRESTIVIENETGRSVGVVSALHDVTQQEELNRRKNDILDVLGHDLRAPLGAIKQNFDVLTQTIQLNEEGEGGDHQKKFLANCQNNIERMSRLIEKILDMRQLESGKIMLKYDTVETSSLLEQAATSLNEWAQNKNITIETKAPALPNIDGDPERLYQIVTNLVSNALKFTPEEGSIIVEGKAVEHQGVEHIKISVKDSGMGIDKDNLEKIFNKYEQVTVNAPAGVRGLGLGLSICKTIVELHGGSIWADSELEKGSTFTFQVPVKQKSE